MRPIETIYSSDLDVKKTADTNVNVNLKDVTAAETVSGIRKDSKGRVLSVDPSKIAANKADQSDVDALQRQLQSLISRVAILSEEIVPPTPPVTIPSGLIAMWSGVLLNIPSGWNLCDGTNGTPDLRDKFVLSVGAAENPGATGGSSTHTHTFSGTPGTTSSDSAGTPAGSVSAPTFTGTPDTTGATSAGTPAGTVSAPTFTGNADTTGATSAGTPTGTVSQPTLSMNSYTPAGTNGSVSFTPSGTIAWPASVPTAANESSHTHSVTSNVSGTLTPAGTIAWPAGVPTAANENAHTHAFTQSSNATTPDLLSVNTAAAGVAASGTTGAGSAHTHTISWPAGVPVFTGTSNQVVSITNNAVTSGAGSAHTHVISWPATVPAFTGSAGTVSAQTFTGTPATLTGTVSQPTFTGDALGTHTHSFTPSGTNSAPTFTGTALGTHSHSFTPSGTNSAPTFTGSALGTHNHTFTPAGTNDVASNVPPYFKLAFIMKL